ncbi:hypothetical protein [Micromonospora noduli]|uniref:hypothetical protein n=1 Tax=Micromonospora noduli TaxID=709876 RepID=UPI003D15F60B
MQRDPRLRHERICIEVQNRVVILEGVVTTASSAYRMDTGLCSDSTRTGTRPHCTVRSVIWPASAAAGEPFRVNRTVVVAPSVCRPARSVAVYNQASMSGGVRSSLGGLHRCTESVPSAVATYLDGCVAWREQRAALRGSSLGVAQADRRLLRGR